MVPGSRCSARSRQLAREFWIGSLALVFSLLAALRADDIFAGTEYVYDDLDRVVQAVDSDGSIVRYH
jgi:hypothetical protein